MYVKPQNYNLNCYAITVDMPVELIWGQMIFLPNTNVEINSFFSLDSREERETSNKNLAKLMDNVSLYT